jgi:hypothetical protein
MDVFAAMGPSFTPDEPQEEKFMLKTRLTGPMLILVMAGFIGGCAVGQTYSIVNAAPDLAMSGDTSLAVGVQDQREYVVSQKNQPQQAGIIRGGWGNPFYVTTTSGRPLSEDMCESICNALKRRGFEPVVVATAPSEDKAAVLKKLKGTGSGHALFFALREWKPDLGAGGNLGLTYDLILSVYSTSGELLAEKGTSGHDDLGRLKGMGFIKVYEEKVSEAFALKAEALFNAPEILAVIQ